MKINRALLWDTHFSEDEIDTETFRRWYTARVLTNGTLEDVQDVGQEMIRQYLPQLWLPAAIRNFWEWYFGLPHAQPTRPDTYYFPNRAA